MTVAVQVAPGASVAPERLAVDEPLAAVKVPLQVVLGFPGVAITSPEGRLSVNATPLSVVFEFEFVSVKVKLVVPFNGMVAAPNPFVIEIGLATTMLAEAVLPVRPPASVAVTLPVVLLATPSAVP